MQKGRRPPELRRSWLFVPGADRAALEAAGTSGADVLIQELEDFTPPARRAEAREAGKGGTELEGALTELPGYMNAKRLIARAEALAGFKP